MAKILSHPKRFEVVDPRAFLSCRIAPARSGTLWGYVNKREDIIIPFKYEWTGEFFGGLAPVKHDGKYGWIDEKGNPVTGFVYSGADNVLGVHRVSLGQKNGEIDSEGNEKWYANSSSYDAAQKFSAYISYYTKKW